MASDVCRSRLKGFSSSPVKSSSSTPAPSSSGKQEEQAGHKNTGEPGGPGLEAGSRSGMMGVGGGQGELEGSCLITCS